MSWITPDEAAAHLGLQAVDQRLFEATLAVKSEVERVRDDLDFTAVPDQVHYGALLWVGDLYQTHNAPTGFAGYGDVNADIYGPLQPSRWASISRLCGLRRPIAL